MDVEALNNGRDVEDDADRGDLVEQVDEPEDDDERATEGDPHVAAELHLGVRGRADGLFGQDLGFGVGEPGGVLRSFGQLEPGDSADDDGEHPLEHEHPLPSAQSTHTVELHQASAERAAHHQGGRRREVEEADRGGPVLLGEPDGDHVHQRGEQARLGRAEQEPQEVEGTLALNEHHQPGQHAPGDRDPHDPSARADLEHGQVAGDLQEGVAEEEQPGTQTVRGSADAQV